MLVLSFSRSQTLSLYNFEPYWTKLNFDFFGTFLTKILHLIQYCLGLIMFYYFFNVFLPKKIVKKKNKTCNCSFSWIKIFFFQFFSKVRCELNCEAVKTDSFFPPLNRNCPRTFPPPRYLQKRCQFFRLKPNHPNQLLWVPLRKELSGARF